MYKLQTHFTLTRAQNGIWYYYAYDENNRRYRRSTGKTNKREAEKEVMRRINAGVFLETIDNHSKLKNMTFAEFAEPFWIYDSCPIIRDKIARGGHYSPDLAAANRGSMFKHIIPYFGDMYLNQITRKTVDAWILNLPRKQGISASTANKMLAMLKQMLRVAVYDGLLLASPAESVKPLIENGKARGAFTQEEVRKLFSIKWDSDMAYTACFLSAFTGMRLGEIRALKLSHVHDDYILVDSSWADIAGLKTTKSGKARIVPITKRIYSMLQNQAKGKVDDDFIFTFTGKKPVEDRYLTKPFKKAMGNAGINAEERNLTFHSFRHFFNTQLVASGTSGEIIRNVIGHESEEMTDRYLHLGSDELSAVRSIQLDLTRDIRRDRI